MMMQRVLLDQLSIFRRLTEPQQAASASIHLPSTSYRTPIPPSSRRYQNQPRANSAPYRPPRAVVYDDEETTMDAVDYSNNLRRSESMEVEIGSADNGDNDSVTIVGSTSTATAVAAAEAIASLSNSPRSPSPANIEPFPPNSPSVVSSQVAIAMDLQVDSTPPPIAPAPVQSRQPIMPVPFIEIIEPQPIPPVPVQHPPIAEQRNNQRPLCAICFEDLLSNRPTALSCYHVFCEACVDRHYHENEDEDEVRCPICREDIYARDDANPLYFP